MEVARRTFGCGGGSCIFLADAKNPWAEMAGICGGIFEKVGENSEAEPLHIGYCLLINDLNSFYAYSKI